jgi:hypothetical protein
MKNIGRLSLQSYVQLLYVDGVEQNGCRLNTLQLPSAKEWTTNCE